MPVADDILSQYDRDMSQEQREQARAELLESRRRNFGARPREEVKAVKPTFRRASPGKKGSESAAKPVSPSQLSSALAAQSEDAVHAASAQALADPECQELIARVMENTIFNIMQEASFGEISLEKQEKRVVRLGPDVR